MEKMPVFIKIESYEDVLDLIEMIRKKTNEAKTTLLKINELKEEEERKITIWKDNLFSIENKLDELNNKLFQPDE